MSSTCFLFLKRCANFGYERMKRSLPAWVRCVAGTLLLGALAIIGLLFWQSANRAAQFRFSDFEFRAAVRAGMDAEAVRAAVGAPTKIIRANPNFPEIWVYENLANPSRVGMRAGYSDAYQVNYRDGRVESITTVRMIRRR